MTSVPFIFLLLIGVLFCLLLLVLHLWGVVSRRYIRRYGDRFPWP